MSDALEWGTDEHLRLELRHLERGAPEDVLHVGLGPIPYRFVAEKPDVVLERAREVLRAAIVAMLRGWDPDSDEIPDEIPDWFRSACAPEGESSDARWSLAEWLPWADPDMRQWFWWDARVMAEGVGELRIETTGWPYPSGALRFLLEACGARDVHEL